MRKTGLCICIGAIGLIVSLGAHAQSPAETGRDTTLYEYRTCKLPVLFSVPVETLRIGAGNSGAISGRKPLLTATGELTYQYFNRDAASDNLLLINSASDIAMLRLSLVYKETYPFAFSFRYNKSRPFQLDDQYEVNIGFDDRGFKELLKEKMERQVKGKFLRDQADLLTNYEQVFHQFQEKKQLLESPAYAQQVIQQRMQNAGLPAIPGQPVINPVNLPQAELPSFITSLPDLDAIKKRIQDSIENRFDNIKGEFHARLEEKKDSLLGLLKRLEDSLVLNKEKYNRQVDSLNKELSEIASSNELQKYATEKGLKDSLRTNK